MAQYIKSKPTTFRNRPVGVVNVNTGAIQAANIVRTEASKLAAQYFQEEEKIQTELGKDVGLTLPVRDKSGELLFQDVPSSLSAVAQSSAKPIIQKRYQTALHLDIFNKIQSIRNNPEIKTSQQFSDVVETEMASYINQTKLDGGEQYVAAMTESVAKLSSQHFNEMVAEEMKEQLKIASLNENSLITKSAKDLYSTAGKMLLDTQTQKDFINMLSTQKEIVNDLLKANDNNLKENDLDWQTHRATNTNIKSTIPRGLLRAFTKNKTYNEILGIRSYIEDGTELQFKDKNGKLIPLNEKQKRILDWIKEHPERESIEIELNTIRQQKKEIEQANRTAKTQEKADKTLAIKELQDDPNNKTAAIEFVDGQTEKFDSIYQNLKNNNFNFNETISANLKKIQDNLWKATTKEGLVWNDKNGQKRRIFLSSKAVASLIADSQSELLLNHFSKSGKFTTSNDYAKLLHHIANPELTILNSEQKEIHKQVKNFIDSFGLQKGTTDILVRKLTNKHTNLNRVERDAITNNKSKNVLMNASQGVFKKTDASTLNDNLITDDDNKLTANYFTGQYQNDLSQNREKAKLIDNLLKKGSFPSSFYNILEKVTSGNGTSTDVDNVIALFSKYESQLKDTQKYNEKDFALLKIASDLIPNYQGTTMFFGVANQDNAPVSSQQMFSKIREAFNSRTDENTKHYLDKILSEGLQNKYKSSFSYLKSLDFDDTEASELSFVVDLAASMGMNGDNLKTLLSLIKEDIYADGQGFILDKLSSGGDSTKSKHSFLKRFPDDKMRANILSQISSDISSHPKGTHLEREANLKSTKGRYIFGYEMADIENKEQLQNIAAQSSNTNLNIRATNEKTTPYDVKVMLHPFRYGPNNSYVRYIAMYQKGQFYVPLYKPDDSLYVYDARDLEEKYLDKFTWLGD